MINSFHCDEKTVFFDILIFSSRLFSFLEKKRHGGIAKERLF
jgi:hypothetical protein